jgi:hypothetical protein
MRLGILALVVLSFLVVSGTAGASYDYGFNERCVNSTARTFQTYEGSTPTGGALNITVHETCYYGCIAGECKTLSHGTDQLPVTVVLVSVFLVFCYIALNMREEHRVLGWLFMSVGLTVGLMAVVSVVELGAWGVFGEAISWLAFAIAMVISFFILYFFYTIITNSFQKLTPYKQNMED